MIVEAKARVLWQQAKECWPPSEPEEARARARNGLWLTASGGRAAHLASSF